MLKDFFHRFFYIKKIFQRFFFSPIFIYKFRYIYTLYKKKRILYAYFISNFLDSFIFFKILFGNNTFTNYFMFFRPKHSRSNRTYIRKSHIGLLLFLEKDKYFPCFGPRNNNLKYPFLIIINDPLKLFQKNHLRVSNIQACVNGHCFRQLRPTFKTSNLSSSDCIAS